MEGPPFAQAPEGSVVWAAMRHATIPANLVHCPREEASTLACARRKHAAKLCQQTSKPLMPRTHTLCALPQGGGEQACI